MTPSGRLQAAIEHANNIVIGASIAIMDASSSSAEKAQSRYFQSLFSEIRNVLQGALADADGSHDEPGTLDRALALASAVLGGEVHK